MQTTTDHLNLGMLVNRGDRVVLDTTRVNYYTKTARKYEKVRCTNGVITVVTKRIGSGKVKTVLPKGSSVSLAVLFNGGKPSIDR
jgi:hypothetical protein